MANESTPRVEVNFFFLTAPAAPAREIAPEARHYSLTFADGYVHYQASYGDLAEAVASARVTGHGDMVTAFRVNDDLSPYSA